MADLPSADNLAEEKKQSFLMLAMIKELAKMHTILSVKLGHPAEGHHG